MHNSVVGTIAKAYGNKDYSTLRFNFRGVGKSDGSYDEGSGEIEDLQAALTFLDQKGLKTIDFAGYSFGAWVSYNYVFRNSLSNKLILVSPPVDFMEFEKCNSLPSLRLTVVGDRDDFANSENLKQLARSWKVQAPFEVIPGADHFYSGFAEDLLQVLERHI